VQEFEVTVDKEKKKKLEISEFSARGKKERAGNIEF
jgi:hypothetical protein